MPETAIRYFRDDDGTTPFLDWLASVRAKNVKAFNKCLFSLNLLSQFGHELRRPHADMLRDGVYELRTRSGRVNYRVLYGFVGKDIVLVSHGITKEAVIPDREIDLAVTRLALYRQDSRRYTAEEEIDDGN